MSEVHTSAVDDHEAIERPNWETGIVCSCGERCTHWLAFYRHRGDAYREQLLAAVKEKS